MIPAASSPAPALDAEDAPARRRRTPRKRRVLLIASLTLVLLLGGALWWWIQGWRDTGTAAWSQEFDGEAGAPPDPAFWTLQTGGGGWGNDELQEYTQDAAALDGEGSLAVTATIPRDGSTPTSGRLTTQGKWSFTYGTLSARIRLPEGVGLLPAFWLLGDSLPTAGWPGSGEIDVIETPSTTSRSAHHIHGPIGGTEKWSIGDGTDFAEPLAADFHTYTLERGPGRVVMRIDDVVVFDASEEDMPADGTWVFDDRFHVLFSLAVGGSWPGSPDETTPEEAVMLIDWIRFTPAEAAD